MTEVNENINENSNVYDIKDFVRDSMNLEPDLYETVI